MTQKSSTDIQSKIDGVNAEKARYVGKLERDLELAQGERLTEAHQKDLAKQIEQANAMYDGLLNQLEGDLTEARREEIRAAAQKQEEQARAAAETKEQIKADLKAAWVRAGGDLEVFEAQFPQLYAEEMSKRAVNQMNKERRAERVIINKSF